MYEINIRGAIFCHVIKIKLLIHESPSITLGNHQCRGAVPLFRSSDISSI